jgi:hypothetical protein
MENEERIKELKNELFILIARRSLRPCVKENARAWAIMAELYELTGNEMYNLKTK